MIGYTTYNGANFSDFAVPTMTNNALTSNQTAFLVNNAVSKEIDVQVTGNPGGIVTWGAATNIVGDTDVFNVGTGSYAYDFSNSTQTVNGVTFTGSASIGSVTGNAGGSVTLTSFTSSNTTAFTVTGLSASYGGMLKGASYATTTSALTVTLNNLTSGHVYATQFWVNDGRGGTNGSRTETIEKHRRNTGTLHFGSTTAGVLGQYALGGFAGDSALPGIYRYRQCSGPNRRHPGA